MTGIMLPSNFSLLGNSRDSKMLDYGFYLNNQ